jgi:hypothetical protein
LSTPRDNNHRPHFIAPQLLREAAFSGVQRTATAFKIAFLFFQLKEKNL